MALRPPVPPVIRKRACTLHKATLEVECQEPETPDNIGTTSAWRLDVPEMNGPGGSGCSGNADADASSPSPTSP